MKNLILLLFVLVLSVQSPTYAHTLTPPPIPKDVQETIAIVVLDNPKSEQEIRQFLAPYKDIQLRHIFQEAIYGFSVKGTQDSIARLALHHKQILTISPVAEYRAETEEGVKIIGGEEVRKLFDKKNERLTGKGVTVGVIDTGVDYTHPDLRRNYAGGHDLVDGDNDPMETRAIGKATLHGTHVAGIIAGNGKIQGVAPEAKIIAYRALGPGGGGTTEQVLAAIEQAIKDKVDIVNLSLGNDINGPDLPISLALNRAVDKGITAVAASGNSGPNVWTVGSPGTASKAISVGASTPTMEIPYLLIEGMRDRFKLQPMEGSEKWALDRSVEIVDGGIGMKEELKNVQGKMVLIKRGRLTFTAKAQNAIAAGAKAVIIYNNMSGSFIGNLETPSSIPVGSLSKHDGDILSKEMKNKRLSARLNIIEEKDRLAEFSSRGPVTGTWEIKPDIVAPGVAINSTVPGGYLSLQGTSMAAPHVAGACALIKQAHPDWTPAEIKAALMNTAKPLVKNTGVPGQVPIYYRTYEQGAGRLQVDDAVKAESLVTPSSIKFGKFAFGDQRAVHKVNLHVGNVSNQQLRYSFAVPEHVDGLEWRFPLMFTLAPKQARDITIELKVEPMVFKGKIQDGYLSLHAGANEIRIPYIYVLEEPDYPRVMGFDFGEGDKPDQYHYEVYLPGGAEEFGIALFNPGDYRFVGFLDTGRNLKKGLIKKDIPVEQLPAEGTYLAKVFAKKANQEDFIETMITIVKKTE
ncbi:S8 family serine peptidase [Neobacillus ginsengisoli]|uniref:Minor extracellular serine protease Vpr n=1 Tax=Neobacillus ginsengisoli TaxID=904295 RepID=A0ABT9XZ61_9BACI|nr:S8 family serine peptidase [Neobacillus ginsengisoli]MDQ0200869.1 minor extracellular serine protease Vpr [Neobacillus ginsengisoli]